MKITEAKRKVRKMGFECVHDNMEGWHDDIILSMWEKGEEQIIVVENMDGGECTIFKSIK